MRVGVLSRTIDVAQRLMRVLEGPPGLPSSSSVHVMAAWADVEKGLAEGAIDVAVADPCLAGVTDAGGADLSSSCSLWTLGQQGKVILYAAPPGKVRSGGPEDLLVLGGVGFPYLIVQGVDDDPRSLRRLIAAAANRQCLLKIDWPGPQMGQPPAVRLILSLLSGWPRPQSVSDLAATVGLAERTLRARLAALALPPPQELLAWSRLLEAAQLCRLGITTRNAVALHVGYEGSSSLARVSRRLAGLTLGQLLEEGGTEAVVGLVARRIGAG